MKTLLTIAMLIAPLAAQASFGPTTTEPMNAGVHITDLAWVPVGTPSVPKCKEDPTHKPVYACVFDDG